jgi:hypothetical protein
MSIASGFSGVVGNQAQTQNLTLNAQRSGAYDAVDKVRVSTPQSLIDTDFEYGQQASKWEQVATQNNRQSMYYNVQTPLSVTAIAGNQTNKYQLVFTTSANVTVVAGTPIFIQDALDPLASGWAYVTTGVSAGTTFTAQVSNQVTTVTCWSATTTSVYQGYLYSNCGINLTGTTAFTFSGSTVTVATTYPHGLSKGSYIFITGTTGPSAATQINGAQIVATVTANNSFTFTNVNGTPSTTIANTAGATNLYARPSGYVTTKAYDGSVNFSAGAAVPSAQLSRQTRRYFRYQSGKGIQFSTGSILNPQIQLPVLTAVGPNITVTTVVPHNLAINTYIQVSGADQNAYNGTFLITSVPSITTFTYVTANSFTPSAATATSTAPNLLHVSPVNWWGSRNRIGFFDLQNGFFYEYDGQTLYAVLRSSVNQIPGTVSVSQGNATVTGTGTAFTTTLLVGDYIVIRGQSYRVLNITSDTSLSISPEYRGTTLSNAIVSRTIDTKIPQSQWYDICDGSNTAANPSGYKLDLTKIQMWYIDYSWYGAGAVRFGFRMTNGAINYVYTFQNNNVQYLAYLRSGNLCSRYEQNNTSNMTLLTASISSSDTTINVGSTNGFNPAGGTVILRASATAGAVEYVTYSSLTGTQLLGCTRGATGGAAATAFTYSATAPVSVEYSSPDTAALLSHWGSSVVMDGGYTSDVSAIYNYGMQTALTSPNSTAAVPIMAIRVAPSVDNGQVGYMGQKEIINRLQLAMRELAVVTNTTYLIQFILNGVPSAAFSGFSGNFTSPTQGTNTSSISQVAVNTTPGTTISGGESVAAFYSNGAGQTTYDLSGIAPFGNAALGGGNSNAVPTSQANQFPDGPDVLYVVASTLTAGASNTIFARLNWAESQA